LFLHHHLLYPCLLNSQNSLSKNSELDDRRSAKLRTTDERRRTGCLKRKLGGWLRKKRSEDERRRRNRGGRRRKNRGGGLRRPRRSMQGRKEIEKARSEKRKAVEMEESREETEKEPEGSNKKVSKTF
jgi:hypothetical protein